MRLVSPVLIVLSAGLLVGSQQKAGSVEGVVTNAETHASLEDVDISISGAGQFTSKTDANGHFVIGGIPLGRYTIRAKREGYLSPSINGIFGSVATAALTIDQNAQRGETALALIKGGTIDGQITDMAGLPVVGESVDAVTIIYQNGRQVLYQEASGSTDDRGNYRLYWLGPGEHFVRVRRNLRNAPSVQAQPENIQTYFPGVVDIINAKPLSISSGATLSSVNFSIQSAHTYRIVLNVSTMTVSPSSGTTPPVFFLIPRSEGTPGESRWQTTFATPLEYNRFEISHVPPGSYDLFGGSSEQDLPPAERQLGGRVNGIVVRNSDIDSVNLLIRKGVSLKTSLSYLASETLIRSFLPNLSVRLETLDNRMYTPGPQKFDANGEAAFPGVLEGNYTIQIVGLPDSECVYGMNQVGQNTDDGVIHVREASVKVQVSVGSACGRVHGTVRTSDGEIVKSAELALVPGATGNKNTIFSIHATTDAQGAFVINGIASGPYRLFAWDKLPYGAEKNAEFIARIEEKGVSIDVVAASNVEVRVPLITAQH